MYLSPYTYVSYTHKHHNQYIVGIIINIFNKLFSVRSAQNFKNASFYLTFIYCFFNAFSFFNIDPSFWFLMLSFFLNISFPQVYWQQIPSTFVCLKKYFCFSFEWWFHRVPNSRLPCEITIQKRSRNTFSDKQKWKEFVASRPVGKKC